MPNEYGEILLQQIEQQRKQRLRQRAEERGLPLPADDQLGARTSAPTLGSDSGQQALLRNNMASDKNAPSFGVPREACQTGTSAGFASDVQMAQESTDVERALQSLLNIAPLLSRQTPQVPPSAGVLPPSCMQSVVPSTCLTQQPIQQLEPSLLEVSSPKQESKSKALTGGSEDFGNSGALSQGIPFSDKGADGRQVQNSKKVYQAALLQQMQERKKAREAEKSRRIREEEEDRIRMNIEIERERREKEEEEAKQLSKKKQLAAANVAAAQPTLRCLRCSHSGAESDAAPATRRGVLRSMSQLRDDEDAQTLKHNTNPLRNDTNRQLPGMLPVEEHNVFPDKLLWQLPSPGLETDSRLFFCLENLKAELRLQIEEMRFLQNQQRQVLQNMNVWSQNECPRRLANTGESADLLGALHALKTPTSTLTPAEQQALQSHRALITLLLRQAGVAEPEREVMQSHNESRNARVCHDATPPITVSAKASASEGKPGIAEKTQTLGLERSSTEETCGGSQGGPPLGRGMSKCSCSSVHPAATTERHSHTHKAANGKDKIVVHEDPEERPLPTLVKRQQQQAEWKAHEPLSQQPRPQKNAEVVLLKPSPAASARTSDCNTPDTDVHGQRTEPQRLPSCDVRQAQLETTPGAPAERRWRFSELWACVTHGFPPPPPRAPNLQSNNMGSAGPWYASSSWCTSDCESELPCQTVVLPSGTWCRKLSERKPPPQQCLGRQINGMPIDGWSSASQMEFLEASTSQTTTSEGDHDRLDLLYNALLAKVQNRRAYEGIRLVEKSSTQNDSSANQLLTRLAEVPQQSQVKHAIDALDCESDGSPADESVLCPEEYRGICRAMSVNAAPLRVQQLHDLEDKIRRQYGTNETPKERCLRQLDAASRYKRAQQGQIASLPRVQERFKSRLSWEAETAFPVNECSRVQSNATQAQVKAFGPRPFAPPLQPPLAQINLDSSSPKPATPPTKHGLPGHHPQLTLENSTKKRSRLTRVFGGMLMRSNSKGRQ